MALQKVATWYDRRGITMSEMECSNYPQGTVGPPTADGLKSAFGSARVAAEGVDYAALLTTNFNPGGADCAGIEELEDLLKDATSKCPDSAIVAGGYR